MLANLRTIPSFFTHPVGILRYYRRSNLQPDLVAGLTVAAILLPQSIVLALLAGLPAQMGLYAGIVAAIVGALWGSSRHLHSGPSNSAAILVLSTLQPFASPGTPLFAAAAGMLAVISGVFRLGMGLARLGVLVNFVSDSVIVGFTAGAGVLIAAGELHFLLRLPSPPAGDLFNTLASVVVHLPDSDLLSLTLGLSALLVIILLKRFGPKLPGALVAIALTSLIVGLFGLD
jgi:sulfate permease, SulP family